MVSCIRLNKNVTYVTNSFLSYNISSSVCNSLFFKSVTCNTFFVTISFFSVRFLPFACPEYRRTASPANSPKPTDRTNTL